MAPDIDEEIEDLLTGEPLVAHLATCRDGRPHVAPLWYVYREGAIEVVTTGRKLDDIRHNDRVALSVQKDVDGDPQWGVTLRGTATVLTDEADGREVLGRINRRYGVDDDAWAENTAVRIAVGSANHWRY
jgi:nitroimidazol reductase NimA-like FMN-containing flavoprotein (pyridoxamine 5'-phosphate oxidase superfamily)